MAEFNFNFITFGYIYCNVTLAYLSLSSAYSKPLLQKSELLEKKYAQRFNKKKKLK